MLLALGLAAMAGSTLGGRALDITGSRWLRRALAGVTASLVLLAAGAAIPALALIALVGFGFAAFASVPVLQGSAIAAAGDTPLVAAGLNISAFNIANTIGAGLGGAAVALTHSPRGSIWLGATLALLAAALLPRLQPAQQAEHSATASPSSA